MLGLEDFMTIQALGKRGVYLCDIAEQLGVHPRIVRRAVRRGRPPAPRRGRRGSVLDPYRAPVDQLLSEGVLECRRAAPRAPGQGVRGRDLVPRGRGRRLKLVIKARAVPQAERAGHRGRRGDINGRFRRSPPRVRGGPPPRYSSPQRE